MSSSAREHEYLLRLCIKAEEDQLTLVDWLKGVTWSLGNETYSSVSRTMISIVVSAFLTGPNKEVRSAAEGCMVALAKSQPEKVKLGY